MQRYHVHDKGWKDIATFHPFPDGTVMTGRSLEMKSQALLQVQIHLIEISAIC